MTTPPLKQVAPVTLQPVLINGAWRQAQAPVDHFQAINPTTRQHLPFSYPVSSRTEVESVIRAGAEAAVALRDCSPDQIATFLEQYAAVLEARADILVEAAYLETALAADARLRNVELPRTTNQLRHAASAARSGAWRMATIDTKANIRSMFAPLNGPVVVFGPNNFPFAFNGVSGGDFAAAIAAGNPVIAKAHPAHPRTSQLLAEAALAALQDSKLPPATVQMLYHLQPEDGLLLVSHPLIGATGFTGSRNGGLKLKEAADHAGKPIYVEMSSVNPVVILPDALAERQDALVTEFVNSCSAGTGQFCTNPGLVLLIADAHSKAFTDAVSAAFQAKAPGILLTDSGPGNIARSLHTLTEAGANIITGGHEVTDGGFSFENTLLTVSGSKFLEQPPALQTEAFGVVSLFVQCSDLAELCTVVDHLDGNLTGGIYSAATGTDDTAYNAVASRLRVKVGRLLNDKMPTGVAVSPAMNHGGPYPATGHPGFTSVGIPASIVRFAALYSYDNVRSQRLPPELQNTNPFGLWRCVDGQWTTEAIL